MWTKEHPKQDGIYFYREEDEVWVVEYDVALRRVYHIGNDVPWGEDMSAKIDGEFWTEPVQFPPSNVTDELP